MIWLLMAATMGVGAVGFASFLFAKRVCDNLESASKRFRKLKFVDQGANATLSSPLINSPPSKFLSVIVPAYNEEDRLPENLRDYVAHLQKRRDKIGRDFTFEILVVDDGSKDRTVQKAMAFSNEYGSDMVRVLKMGKNGGKGLAVREGMLRSRGAICLFADADGATPIAELDNLERELRKVAKPYSGKSTSKESNYSKHSKTPPAKKSPDDLGDYSFKIAEKVGMAVGSRAHLEQAALARRKWYRNILTHGFHFLVWFVIGGRIRDTQCGFKMFTRKSASLIFPNQRLQRYCFDVELINLANGFGIPVKEVEVRWTEIPGSKVKLHHIIEMAVELFLIKFGYSFLGGWRAKESINWKKIQ